MKISVPELCLVVMVGPPGSGKSTLARRLFQPTEVLSSDTFRALVSDDEENQACSEDAFRIMGEVARARLRRGRLTVVDACNLGEGHRRQLLDMAKECYVKAGVLLLDVPAAQCAAQASARTERFVPPSVVREMHRKYAQEARPKILSVKEKWAFRYVLGSADAAAAVLEKVPLPVRRRELAGPFDLIGDVHGCYDELCSLLSVMGYEVVEGGLFDRAYLRHPQGRTAVFLGDLVDRGPKVTEVLRLVMGSAARGTALCVLGNHDDKFCRALQGKKVQVPEGLRRSLEQMEGETSDFRDEVVRFLSGLPSHLVLDGGKLVAAHAGLPKEMHGRDTDEVTRVAMYGVPTGETDSSGHPVRSDWAADYRGESLVVFGHVVEPEVKKVNNTYCVDTGCVFGHHLSALRYPEREVASVLARQVYIKPEDFTFESVRMRQVCEADRMRDQFLSSLEMPLDAGQQALSDAEAMLAQYGERPKA